MKTDTASSIPDLLRSALTARQAEISAAWSKAISDFRRFDNLITSKDIADYTERILKLILSEPYETESNHSEAQAIGAALVGRAFTNPEILGLSLKELAEQLPAGLPAALLTVLNPRLASLLADMAIGFTRQMAQAILLQQEQIRAAVETARLQAEQTQRDVQDRNRAILQVLPDALTIADMEGVVQYYHVGDPNRVQMDQDAVLGRNIQEFVPASVAKTALEAYQKAQLTGKLQTFVWSVQGENATRTFETRVVPYTAEQVLILNRDITDLQQAEDTLQRSNKLLQQLNQQLIVAQENERLAIARDLHDIVLNQIGALVITLDGRTIPEDIQEHYRVVVDQLRQTINILRPPLLNYGLRPALSELVDDLADFYGSNAHLELQVSESHARFDPAIEAHLFRIVQQACENALRHAQASLVIISGDITRELVDLSVKDNGAGFEVKEPIDLGWALAEKHFGIAGMLERGELIGAQVRITSSAGTGTLVKVRWQPVEPF